MIKINSMTDNEIKEMAEAFADYDYGKNEKGLVVYFPDREKLIANLTAMIRSALQCGMVYATSEQKEGIIIITDTTEPMPFIPMLKLFHSMIKALTFKGFTNFTKHAQSGGGSIEAKFRKEKKQFIQVEMLVVRKQYQGQGYMRKLLGKAFELADKKQLPCIIVTDAALKKDKYVHLGMKLVNTRQADDGVFMYDMVRENH